MAKIAIITNEFDEFTERDYLLHVFSKYWGKAGHEVVVAAGLDRLPAADVAVLHVDLSLTPAAFVEAARARYARVINGGATDIRKRAVSQNLVERGDAWAGPVVVKTDLNCSGYPEARHHSMMKKHGKPAGDSPRFTYLRGPYRVYPSMAEVPATAWNYPGVVVEKFLPEHDEAGYWMRAWVFLGDKERCTRYRSQKPIIKSADVMERHACEVPDAIRAERVRLGFDFGKFDFVLHEGRPILLDANRTPGAPPPSPEMDASNAELARGVETFLV